MLSLIGSKWKSSGSNCCVSLPSGRHANPHPHLRDNLNWHYTEMLKKENISFVPMILEMQ